MSALRFASICVLMLVLFTVCAVLTPQTMDMIGRYSGVELGPGVLPAMCLLSIIACMLYVFFSELRLFRVSRGIEKQVDEDPATFGLPLPAFLVRSFMGLGLLWLYVILWQLMSFLPATFVFCVTLAFLILDRKERTLRTVLRNSAVLVAIDIGIWFAFARLLMVPLR